LSAFGSNYLQNFADGEFTEGPSYDAAAVAGVNDAPSVAEFACYCNDMPLEGMAVICDPDFVFGCRGLASVAASDRIAMGGTLSSYIGLLTDLKYLCVSR
jgi:hypothetical protein